jgi:hypothetical protein
VAESGRHGELLEAGGLYAELWSKQAHQGGVTGSEGTASVRGSHLSLADLEVQSVASAATAASTAVAAAATGTNVGGGGAVSHHHHQ